jgi:hypothetical protein
MADAVLLLEVRHEVGVPLEPGGLQDRIPLREAASGLHREVVGHDGILPVSAAPGIGWI